MRLNGKVAIITGAGMGMGREASLVFAKEGAKIVAFDINEKFGKETAELIKQDGGDAIYVQGDASKEADVKNAIKKGVEAFGAIHILYANAGVLWKDRDRSVVDIAVEDWDLIQAINLRGPFLLAKHGIPELKKAGGGSIIFIGSIAAFVGFSSPQDAYASTKGALIALTKSLAVQFGPDNIRCNIIHPGMIDTPMLDDPSLHELKVAFINALPLRRSGVTRDVINVAVFFASDESSYITGAELVVDGGFLAV